MSDPPLTPGQVKSARGLLGWWQSDLAARIRVNERTIRAFEANELWGVALDLDLVRTALEIGRRDLQRGERGRAGSALA